MDNQNFISEPDYELADDGTVSAVRFSFGPHYYVSVEIEDGRAVFKLQTSDKGHRFHGITADASEEKGELEQFIEELKRAHPDKAF